MGTAEVATDAVLEVGALLLGDDGDRSVIHHADAADDGSVIGELPIPVQFEEGIGHAPDIGTGGRPVGIAGKLDALPGAARLGRSHHAGLPQLLFGMTLQPPLLFRIQGMLGHLERILRRAASVVDGAGMHAQDGLERPTHLAALDDSVDQAMLQSEFGCLEAFGQILFDGVPDDPLASKPDQRLRF